MKMQDRIEKLSEELGATQVRVLTAMATISEIDNEALAISEIEAVIDERLKRGGYLRSDQDKIDRVKLVRVFQFVADRHGVELVRHL